ncbi:MAG: hypothetical protein U1F53_17030 [Burkholderiaceae bacterium]
MACISSAKTCGTWSVTELDAFWRAVGLLRRRLAWPPPTVALAEARVMPARAGSPARS